MMTLLHPCHHLPEAEAEVRPVAGEAATLPMRPITTETTTAMTTTTTMVAMKTPTMALTTSRSPAGAVGGPEGAHAEGPHLPGGHAERVALLVAAAITPNEEEVPAGPVEK